MIRYRSGACYEGDVSHVLAKREGRGVLEFSNGARYEGEFRDNKRHGKGVQVWPSGETYEGEFVEDERHGHGEQKWENGERYHGEFVKDCRHGQGTYSWPNGSLYTGSFENNKKHGHGVFTFANGSRFEGEYQDDQRCGHGVMTYPDGSQDVGVWKREQLTKLYNQIFESAADSPNKSQTETGSRSASGAKGPIEMASEQLIGLSANGNTVQVQELLETGKAYVDVADGVGFTALIAASINCRLDIVNILLDNGADVNKMNDEGVSALTLCYHLLYEKLASVHELSEQPESLGPTIELKNNGRSISVQGNIEDMRFLDRMSRTEGWLSAGYHSAMEGEDICEDQRRRERGRSDSGMGRDESEGEETDKEERDTEQPRNGQNKPDQANMKITLYNWKSPLEIRSTIHLLLNRGADPNCSHHPLPPLFYTIKCKDLQSSKLLLKKGASTATTLTVDKGGDAPLHVAVRLSGQKAVRLVELLLQHGADPNQRMANDAQNDPFKYLERRRASIQTVSSLASGSQTGDEDVLTQTALHIVCARLDYHQLITNIVAVLLKCGANPNLIAHGHSPLSLTIGSGNDETVDLLLKHGADPNLVLGRGVGSALCAVSALHSQRRRSTEDSIQMINRLVECGANILLPVKVSMKFLQGTAVDYAHWAFHRDKHISQLPYNALTKDERHIYNGRMKVLQHMADVLRDCAMTKLAQQLTELSQQADEVRDGGLSEMRCETLLAVEGLDLQRGYSMSTISELELEERARRPPPRMPMFTTVMSYSGAASTKRLKKHPSFEKEMAEKRDFLPRLLMAKRSLSVPTVDIKRVISPLTKRSATSFNLRRVSSFPKRERTSSIPRSMTESVGVPENLFLLKSLHAGSRRLREPFEFCNHCGRSVGVKLICCPRCKKVSYCSRVCRIRGWETRHKHECIFEETKGKATNQQTGKLTKKKPSVSIMNQKEVKTKKQR